MNLKINTIMYNYVAAGFSLRHCLSRLVTLFEKLRDLSRCLKNYVTCHVV
jgi:hypothetical protein